MKQLGLIACLVIVAGLFAQPLLWPLKAGGRQWISSPLGDRTSPMGGQGSGYHSGLDIAARVGTPVLAVGDGVVVSCYPPPGGKWKGDKVYGGMVVLRLLDGRLVLYGHLSACLVSEGAAVKAGQTIGLVGSTGVSTGPHLHFEVLADPIFSNVPELAKGAVK